MEKSEELQKSAARDNLRALVAVVMLVLAMVACVVWILTTMNQRVNDIKKQSDNQTAILTAQNKSLRAQNQALQEANENITCTLAILAGPDKFPSADQEKCRQRLAGINNTDGTFFSSQAQGQSFERGEKGDTGSQGKPGNNGQNGNNGQINGIINSVGKAATGIINQLP